MLKVPHETQEHLSYVDVFGNRQEIPRRGLSHGDGNSGIGLQQQIQSELDGLKQSVNQAQAQANALNLPLLPLPKPQACMYSEMQMISYAQLIANEAVRRDRQRRANDGWVQRDEMLITVTLILGAVFEAQHVPVDARAGIIKEVQNRLRCSHPLDGYV